MFVQNLQLSNFRNFLEKQWTFEQTHNIVLGSNGAGKTNFLESLYYLSFGRSFRVNSDAVVTHKESVGFYIKGEYRHHTKDTIEISYFNKEKKIQYNNKPVLRKELISRFKTVLLDADDIFLIKGSAAYRRKYLDVILSQTDPDYLNSYMKYRTLIKQKNIILKKKVSI